MKVEMDSKENKKKNFFIWIFILLLLLISGVFFTYKIFFDKPTEKATIVAGDFLPDGKDALKMTEDEKLKYAQEVVDKSNFNMRIMSETHFNKDTMKGSLAIQNPPQNSQPVNVVVTLDDNQLKVYESGAINPGEEIKEATLMRDLNSGSYPATATFSIYNSDTKKKQGEVKALLTLVVDK